MVSELQLHHSSVKKFKVLENFMPEKDYGVPIRRQIRYALGLLEKGKEYFLNDLVLENKNNSKLFKESVQLVSVRQVFKHVMRDGKKIGMIKEIDRYDMSFDEFCNLDTIAYMRKQLSTTKIKHSESSIDSIE